MTHATTSTGTMPWRQSIPVDRLLPNPDNPREEPKDLDVLEISIRTIGLQEPLLVVPAPDKGDEKHVYYYITDGWRRYLAMYEWNTQIPCIVTPLRQGETLTQRFVTTALVTGITKRDLNPIERAKGFQRLRKEFGLNSTEIGKMVGLSTPTVTNSLALLELSEDTQKRVAKGSLKVTDAMKVVYAKRARDRRARGGSGKMGAQTSWEPDWFTVKHALATKAVALCNRREHNNRRRIGANSGFRGACGQCWESVIRTDQDLVIQNEAEARAGR